MERRPILDNPSIDQELLRTMTRFVKSKLPGRDPRDFVQGAIVRSLQALDGKQLNPAYLWRALRSEIVDAIRREAREKPTSLRVIRDPKITEHPEFLACLALSPDVRTEDREVLEKEILDGGNDGKMLNAASRKRLSRARMRVTATLFLKWYEERRYREINHHRFSIGLMKETARLALKRGVDLSCFMEAFEHPQLSPAIQNATWALRSVAPRVPSVTTFLEEQVRKGHLFRGNISYIFETLTALDPQRYMGLYRQVFLPSLWELPSRALPDTRPFWEQEPFQQRCIVDVVPFVPITIGISLEETELVRKKFLDGADDVDLRRSLTWQLLRLRPEDSKTLGTAVGTLADEDDQINAYYITKFIMGPGLRLFSGKLLTWNTVKTIRAAANRWPQNAYFSESAARVAMKLKTVQGEKTAP